MRKADHSPSPTSLVQAISGFLPMLVCAAAGLSLPGFWRLPLLLLAQALAIGACAHALGHLQRRHPAGLAARVMLHAVLMAGFTAWLWLLTAWPLASLSQAPSLAAVLLLSLALSLVLASLWAWWPWCALLLMDDPADAAPNVLVPRGIGARASRLAHATGARPDLFMLPVGLCQMAATSGVLVLSGLTPWSVPTSRLLVAGALLMLALPLLGLLVVWRCAAAREYAAAGHETEQAPAPTEAPVAAPSLNLSVEDIMPGQRERALLEAARHGDTERALALLAADADPLARPSSDEPDQRSVLVLATLLPDTRLLRALIARGASVQGDGKGMAPLLIAVRDGRQNRSNAVMTLLANGADARVTDAERNTALHYAALGDNADIAAMLIDAGADIDASNRGGYTPLGLACQSGNYAIAEYLLDSKASPAAEGSLPALIALADGTEDAPDMVELLLAHRAAADVQDVLGRSALIHAALSGHGAIVSALLHAGARVDHVDQRGTTALMEAARCGSNATLQVLAEAQPDVTLRDMHGRDALLLACQSPHADRETVRILLELGADPRAAGKDGRSALDHAASAGRWNLVALLDPDTPLPASHCDDLSPEPGADSPQHLLDALRFGHWAAVSGFRQRFAEWSEPVRVELYLQLLEPGHANARRWLFENGLDPASRRDDGLHLAGAVLDSLPQSMEALDELLHMGQDVAGRGLLAHAMGRLGSAAEGAALTPKLIDHGGDLFGSDADGKTPVHHAAAHGMLHTLTILLQRGCDPNVRDREGQTPLHHALKQSLPQATALLRALVLHGADPEAADSAGETPLGQVLEADNEVCERWLHWSPWPLPPRPLRATDLHAAAAAGDAPAVERLLELGFAVDTRDAQGATALLRACGNGHLQAARVLLERHADVRLSTPGGATALTAAVTGKHTELVSLLLEQQVQIDQRLQGGATALLVSAALGHADIAELLLERGADVRAADDAGRTALHAASQFCFGSNDSLASHRLLDVLLTHGADAARTDRNGASALLFMLGAHARPGSPCNATHLGALLPVLLEAGAPASAADERGVTPLHACAMHALSGPARLLLARGADRDARDNHRRSAADVARILGFIDVAHELSGS